MATLADSPLGKATAYPEHYDNSVLCPIPRQQQRANLALSTPLPFHGQDIFYAYEMSWLTMQGKPAVAIGEFIFPCTSPCLIESKSLKLYLNSFNQTPFASQAVVLATLEQDLTRACGAPVTINLFTVEAWQHHSAQHLTGTCLDTLDISAHCYEPNADLLQLAANLPTKTVREIVYSHLLRSNCPITQQPDWGTVQIAYTGKPINHAALLKYIISFRHHQEFHEHCMERMFVDMMAHCRPEQLTVLSYYTRRGGISTNVYRTTEAKLPMAILHWAR